MSLETESFVRALPTAVPELAEILADNEDFGLLPHLTMAEIAQWTNRRLQEAPKSAAVRDLLAELEIHFHIDVDPRADNVSNLIAVSYLENLDLSAKVTSMLPSKLRSHVDEFLR